MPLAVVRSLACAAASAVFLGAATAVAQTPTIRVNFQDPSTPAPAGYLRDFGQAYGQRTLPDQGGQTYGWVEPGTSTPVDLSVGGTTPGNGRNRGTPSDVRLATFMHMQAGAFAGFNGTARNGAWEIALPNGSYDVTLSVGDAQYTDSVHGVSVEGTPAVAGFTPTSATRFRSASVTVSVSDGRLTLAPSGTNTKINFVEIAPSGGSSAVCGNGVVETPETCDDGNTTSGDGCSATCTTESSSGAVVARVNAGGGAFVDTQGRSWSADSGFNTGVAASAAFPGPDPQLYGTERWDSGTAPELRYSFAVSAGTYRVHLHFAEIYAGAAFVGGRVFDVAIEGTTVLSGLDVFAEAGFQAPLVKTVDVAVSDGSLTIDFTHRVENPKLSGIEVLVAGSAPPPPPPPPPPPSGEQRLTLTRLADSGGWTSLPAATDGNPTTAAHKPTAGSEWIEYGLGATYTLTRARLNEDNAGSWSVETWRLQGWSGSAWADVTPLVPTPTAGWSEAATTSLATSRVRVQVQHPTHVEVREIEVYGSGGSAPPPSPVCGNDVLEPPEQCDDGNTAGGDGCSATCTLEPSGSGPCVPSPSQFPGQSVSPLHCALVKVSAPYLADFAGAPDTVPDRAGVGTGLTMILPRPSGTSYLPANVAVDTSARDLTITTTAGIQHGANNSLDNALGVGLDVPNQDVRVRTALVNPPAGSGAYEQAGLWFGISQKDYVKLTLVSTPGGPVLQGLIEQADVPGTPVEKPITLPVDRVSLALDVRPSARTITLLYGVGSGAPLQVLTTFSAVPDAWFSIDAAGIDFNVGTRSFAGLSATHRNRTSAAGPLVYRFDSFELSEPSGAPPPPPPPPPPNDGIDFSRWSFPVANPTAIAHGPDGRVYVATAAGTIHAFRLDHDTRTVASSSLITSVQNRLVLGLTVDPASTPGNVVLWASHSNVSQGSGQANSGTVSRLSGANHATRQDVIVGLPRAVANHSINHLHFGPDGRLYVAMGGNTGAGAANDGISEFGPRPEQPLSAALLVADVKSPTFDGDCTPTQDPAAMDSTGIATKEINCDVQVHASGLRNSYDFAFHSNGELYATDNGLGVEGTIPRLSPDPLSWNPANGCEGKILGAAERAAHNPGPRPDLLHRIVPGAFYGHPNPSRDECVFFGGNPTAEGDFPVPNEFGGTDLMETTLYPTGRQPDPDFGAAIFSFGGNKSANGIVEYASQAFCGALDGDLLVTYYSTADQVRRVVLSGDGRSVVGNGTLPRSTSASGGATLGDPLPIAQDPLGRLLVGEFGAGRVAVFEPVAAGCWQTDGVPALPVPLLDAAGAVLNGELYVVAGKTASGPQRSVHVYSPLTNQWRQAPPLPAAYPAVENPAVVALQGRLYVIGGSTEPFAGSVANVARFDPATQGWTMLASLPAPRGGATAQAIAGRIYVAGGMEAGSSRRELFVYDPATNAWTQGAPMSVPRDNPVSAAVGGKLYVFGGRTRLAAGFPENGTLSSAEAYDPLANAWQPIMPMPTGRRTGNAVVVNGRILVFGGEGAGTFAQNELYDPASDSWQVLEPMPLARHGAVAGRMGNGIFVVGGGPLEGTSFTADVDVFRFE